jgi:catechol 2,3-dioxygenase-like lactoylglutathione lyase family enzyme
MISYHRFDHVYISVPPGEEHRANDFFVNVMGFEPKERPASLDGSGGYWYQLPGMELHIGTEEGPNHSKRHFAMEVDNLEEARRHLQMHGVTIKEEIPITGRDRFTFRDPYGNRIELLEYHKS